MRSSEKHILKQNFWLWLIATVTWMGLIFIFSGQANSNQITQAAFGSLNFWIRKLAHVSEYAILAILVRQTLAQLAPSYTNEDTGNTNITNFDSPGRDTSSKQAITLNVAAVLFSFVYAISDEWHQSFIPGRSAAYQDVLIDTSGAVAGIILYMVLAKIRKPK